jgi:hypothetical protein
LLTLFATKPQRRMAREEAGYTLDRHGDRATEVLREKAKHTHSLERRIVYKLAAREAAKRVACASSEQLAGTLLALRERRVRPWAPPLSAACL